MNENVVALIKTKLTPEYVKYYKDFLKAVKENIKMHKLICFGYLSCEFCFCNACFVESINIHDHIYELKKALDDLRI